MIQSSLSFIYKAIRKINLSIKRPIHQFTTFFLLYFNQVKFSSFKSNGIPYIMIARGGKCTVGRNFSMHNANYNPIGRQQRCILIVDKNASLKIGKNVGISGTAIITHKKITIGYYVKIGGNVCIYDTDFHSLNPEIRKTRNDSENKVSKEVFIGENVFIGAHSTILKGVHIGENSIVGAGSVITKSIPANEVWAGNPARFIKKLQ